MSANQPAQPRNPPTADLNPHHVQIAPRLYRAAKVAAQRAISNYASDDEQAQLDAAYSAGAAVEYLGRAVVAAHDPLLLAKHDSIESRIMLSRANPSDALNPKSMRTVDSSTIWALLEKLNPKFTKHTNARGQGNVPHVHKVMAARNAAAHMAFVDKVQLEESARALVTIIESLHPFGQSTETQFWPKNLMPTVQLLKDENSTELARSYEAKIHTARTQLEQLLNGMNAKEKEHILLVLETRSLPQTVRERHVSQPHPCPACNRTGAATYIVEEGPPEGGEWHESPGGSYFPNVWSRALYFHAANFQCPACGFQLEAEEFAHASIPTELDEDWEEIEDPYIDYEPDEDELRGR